MKQHKTNRIALKLAAFFSTALLLLVVVLGTLFTVQFKNYSVRLTEQTLTQRSAHMASTLSQYLSSMEVSPSHGRFSSQNFRTYVDNLSEIALCDIWLVDDQANVLLSGQKKGFGQMESLPEGAQELVRQLFQKNRGTGSQTASKNGFLTVATPIVLRDGQTAGVMVLSSPITGSNGAAYQGIRILTISAGIALVLALGLSLALSFTFTRPLNRMKGTALRLAQGDYTAKTGVHQKDEIGELADVLDQLSIRLNEAAHQSERLEKIRQDYVANISHELRTPLTVIRGTLESLCDGVVKNPEEVAQGHWQMLEETKGLQRLVSDLLDLSRLQNPDFVVETTALNLADVLQDVVRSGRSLAQNRQVLLQSTIPQKSIPVEGDYGRLRQMFFTILDNAVKFSEPGQTVAIQLEEAPLQVTISDEGKGMAREELPYIFQRFYKTKSPENRNGTGLGLAIAKQIALRHHITLQVQSTLGKGSVFTFRFPDKKTNSLNLS